MSRRTTKQRRAARRRKPVDGLAWWRAWHRHMDLLMRHRAESLQRGLERGLYIGRIAAIDVEAGTITVEASAKIARSSNA